MEEQPSLLEEARAIIASNDADDGTKLVINLLVRRLQALEEEVAGLHRTVHDVAEHVGIRLE